MRRLRSFTLAVVVAFQVAAAPALAASSEDKPLNLDVPAEAERTGGGSGGGSILRTLFGLAIVIGVIFALHWILKQIKGGRSSRAGGTGLEAVATLPLGAGRTLHLVQVGSELVLVGSSEQGVTSIRSYGEQEARALGMVDDVPVVEGSVVDGPALPAGTVIAPRVSDPAVQTSRPVVSPRVHAAGEPHQSFAVRFLDSLRQLTVRR